MRISFDKDITGMTTFGIRTRCAAFVEYESAGELVEALKADLPRPLLFIGGGSNLLFTGDFPGTVLHSRIRFIRPLASVPAEDAVAAAVSSCSAADASDFADAAAAAAPSCGAADASTSADAAAVAVTAAAELLVEVGSGVVFDDFCGWASERGLWGVENLSHIPGEVGASAVQNVGAYGVEACDVIRKLRCLSLDTLDCVEMDVADCGYGYRDSRFKREWKGKYVILSVVFALSGAPAPRLDYGHLRSAVEAAAEKARGSRAGTQDPDAALTPALIREVVTAIRREKLPEPSELGSAGSFFKNPVVSAEVYARIAEAETEAEAGDAALPGGPVGAQPAKKSPQIPHYTLSQPDGSVLYKIPAAWMIERCGWKGRVAGNAAVYSRQPLVLVNYTGRATAADIIALERAIVESVKNRFGVELTPEVEHI